MNVRKHLLSLALLVPLCLAGCGDSHEGLIEEMAKLPPQYNEALSSVKDEATAKAAAEKIRALTDEAKALTERMKKLGPVEDPQKLAELSKKIASGPIGSFNPSELAGKSKRMMKVFSDHEIMKNLHMPMALFYREIDKPFDGIIPKAP